MLSSKQHPGKLPSKKQYTTNHRKQSKTNQSKLQRTHVTSTILPSPIASCSNLGTIQCNDELIINTLQSGIKTISNPFIRKIVIHKPFKTSLGHILPHLELEFLDYSTHDSATPYIDGLVQHQMKQRIHYSEIATNALQHIIPHLPHTHISNQSSHPSLSFTTTTVPNLPTTVIPSYQSTFNQNSQPPGALIPPSTSTTTHHDYNQLVYNHIPVTLVFPSMSHSCNVTNPIHYTILNNRLADARNRSNLQLTTLSLTPADIATQMNIPTQYMGESGWWNTFVRSSISSPPSSSPPSTSSLSSLSSLHSPPIPPDLHQSSHNQHTPTITHATASAAIHTSSKHLHHQPHHRRYPLKTHSDILPEDHYPQDYNIAIDLNTTRLISLSPLGSAYGSSSSLSPNPLKVYEYQQSAMELFQKDDGICFRNEFPIITPFDQATAAAWLLDALDLISFHALDTTHVNSSKDAILTPDYDFITKPRITEVLPGVPTILSPELLEHSYNNYKRYTALIRPQDSNNTNNENNTANTNVTATINSSSPDSIKAIPLSAVFAAETHHSITALQEPPIGQRFKARTIQPIQHQFPQPQVNIIHTTLNPSVSSLSLSSTTPIIVSHDIPCHASPTISLNTPTTPSISTLNAHFTPSSTKQLHAMVGSSMGGQSVLAFASLYPHIFARAAAIATTAQTSPHTQAIRSIQRRCVTSDALYKNGNFRSTQIPLNGLQLSRMIGMLNYRSTEEFNSRFSTIPADNGYTNDVEYYLQHHANKFTNFNPLSYITLSKSMDLMDISMVTGDWTRTVQRMGKSILSSPSSSSSSSSSASELPATPMTMFPKETEYMLLGIKEDELIPFNELQQLGRLLGRYASTHYETISSIYGHDAFLIDVKKFAPRLGTFLLPPPCNVRIHHASSSAPFNINTLEVPITGDSTHQHISITCNEDNPQHYSGYHSLNRYLKAIND